MALKSTNDANLLLSTADVNLQIIMKGNLKKIGNFLFIHDILQTNSILINDEIENDNSRFHYLNVNKVQAKLFVSPHSWSMFNSSQPCQLVKWNDKSPTRLKTASNIYTFNFSQTSQAAHFTLFTQLLKISRYQKWFYKVAKQPSAMTITLESNCGNVVIKCSVSLALSSATWRASFVVGRRDAGPRPTGYSPVAACLMQQTIISIRLASWRSSSAAHNYSNKTLQQQFHYHGYSYCWKWCLIPSI